MSRTRATLSLQAILLLSGLLLALPGRAQQGKRRVPLLEVEALPSSARGQAITPAEPIVDPATPKQNGKAQRKPRRRGLAADSVLRRRHLLLHNLELATERPDSTCYGVIGDRLFTYKPAPDGSALERREIARLPFYTQAIAVAANGDLYLADKGCHQGCALYRYNRALHRLYLSNIALPDLTGEDNFWTDVFASVQELLVYDRHLNIYRLSPGRADSNLAAKLWCGQSLTKRRSGQHILNRAAGFEATACQQAVTGTKSFAPGGPLEGWYGGDLYQGICKVGSFGLHLRGTWVDSVRLNGKPARVKLAYRSLGHRLEITARQPADPYLDWYGAGSFRFEGSREGMELGLHSNMGDLLARLYGPAALPEPIASTTELYAALEREAGPHSPGRILPDAQSLDGRVVEVQGRLPCPGGELTLAVTDFEKIDDDQVQFFLNDSALSDAITLSNIPAQVRLACPAKGGLLKMITLAEGVGACTALVRVGEGAAQRRYRLFATKEQIAALELVP